MGARVYSEFPERKVAMSPKPSKGKAGMKGSVKVKTANWAGLPGKASNWYKVGGPKPKCTLPKKGLC